MKQAQVKWVGEYDKELIEDLGNKNIVIKIQWREEESVNWKLKLRNSSSCKTEIETLKWLYICGIRIYERLIEI